MKISISLIITLVLLGCVFTPNHVTLGVGSATHALTGEIKGPQPFISATYDLKN